MSAQPIHEEPDPRDPQVIHDQLPAAERPAFLREYRAAVDGAREPAGYKHLQRVLARWRLTADALADPAYHDALTEARTASEAGLSMVAASSSACM